MNHLAKFFIIGFLGAGLGLAVLAAPPPTNFLVEVDTKVPTLTCSPLGGTYVGSVTVTCSTADGMTVAYTLDTTLPSRPALFQREVQVFLNEIKTYTLTAVAWDAADNQSIPFEESYTVIVAPDDIRPRIDAFDVQPRLLNIARPAPTISWTVSDTGGSYLKQVEVWRTTDAGGAPDKNGWQKISEHSAPVNSNTWSGSASDNSLTDGVWWYGLHVLDNAGNLTDESTLGNLYEAGPIKALRDTIAPTIKINTSPEQCYKASPVLDVDFSDARGLADGFYQIDSYSGVWTAIFSNFTGADYTEDFSLSAAAWLSLSEAVHTIYFKTTDDAGNARGQDGTVSLALKKDIAPPQTSIKCNNTACSDSWYTQNVTSTLSCADTGCGCSQIYYCRDQSTSTPCTPSAQGVAREHSFVIATNGTHYVRYYSIDLAGNQETATRVQVIKIDKEKPNITAFEMKSSNPKNSHFINFWHRFATTTWQATDTGGSHLNRAQLFGALYNRTNCSDTDRTGCSWSQLGDVHPAPLNSDFWAKTPYPYPPNCPVKQNNVDACLLWHSLKVWDNAGNPVDESDPANTYKAGPIKLSIDKELPAALITAPEENSVQKPPSFELEAEFTDYGLGLEQCQYAIYDFTKKYRDIEDYDWQDMGDCAGQDEATLTQTITVGAGKDCQCPAGFTACSCLILVRAEDVVGNWSTISFRSFKVTLVPDDQPPVTTIICNGERGCECQGETCGLTDWYNTDVRIAFECQDNIACDRTYWCRGAAPCTPNYIYTGTTTLSLEASHYFSFYSVDKAQLRETVKTQKVQIDKTRPIVADPGGAPADWVSTDQTATFTSCQDALSGCNPDIYGLCSFVYPSVEQPPACIYSSSTAITAYSQVYAWAYDYASNQGISFPPVWFRIDKDKPVSDIISPPAHSWQKQNFQIQASDKDVVCNPDNPQLCLPGGSGLVADKCRYDVLDVKTNKKTKENQSRSCNLSFSVTVGPSGDCSGQGLDACEMTTINEDRTGHISERRRAASNVVPYSIDYTAPQVGQTSPLSAQRGISQEYSASVSDNIEISWCELYVDDVNRGAMALSSTPCQSCTASLSYTFTTTGPHTMYAQCADLAGNVTAGQPVTVTVETLPNVPPSAIDLLTTCDYCKSPFSFFFFWTFFDPGDTQSAYQVQIDNNSDFSSPIDSGKIPSMSWAYAYDPSQYPPEQRPTYNTTYFWRLKVWDSYNVASDWTVGPGFTTPTHAYPQVDFTWTPQRPLVNQNIQFTDNTVYASTPATWQWNFGDTSTSDLREPTHTYSNAGLYTVTFTAADADNYSCSMSKDLRAYLTLPRWQEIPPF